MTSYLIARKMSEEYNRTRIIRQPPDMEHIQECKKTPFINGELTLEPMPPKGEKVDSYVNKLLDNMIERFYFKCSKV